MSKDTTNKTYNIVQFSDLHLYEDGNQTLLGLNTDVSFGSVLEMAQKNHWTPDLVLATGDLVHEGLPSSYKKLHKHLDSLNIPVYCLPGNHDHPKNMDKYLNSGHVSTKKQIFLGQWQIIMLDSTIAGEDGGCLVPEELDFLQQCLQENSNLFTLVCLHHHPVYIKSEWLDTMALANPEEFYRVIDGHDQVKAVVFGHIHQEYRAKRNGVEIISAPSTCIQFKPYSPRFAVDSLAPGYRWFGLQADGQLITGVQRLDQVPAEIDIAASGY